MMKLFGYCQISTTEPFKFEKWISNFIPLVSVHLSLLWFKIIHAIIWGSWSVWVSIINLSQSRARCIANYAHYWSRLLLVEEGSSVVKWEATLKWYLPGDSWNRRWSQMSLLSAVLRIIIPPLHRRWNGGILDSPRCLSARLSVCL